MTGYIFGDVAIASDRSSAAVFERTGQTIARSGIDNETGFAQVVVATLLHGKTDA